MTGQRWGRWALGAVCAASIAAPLAAQAQMYPPPMYPQAFPTYPQEIPPRVRVFSYEGAPVVSPGDEPGNWDARQNNLESRRYETLVRSNPSFRAHREQQECGTIGDPAAQAECLSTFNDSRR